MDNNSLQELEKYFTDKTINNKTYIPTNIGMLDRAIDGYYEGTIWVIGGWPGAGKTTFIINLISKLRGQRISVFDTETSKYRYLEKLLCCLTDISDKSIRTNDEQAIKLVKSNLHILKDYNLNIIDKSSPTLKDIEDELKINKPRILIIDYFQNLDIPGGTNRYGEFTNLARNIEKLTKKYRCTTLLASQLKKPLEINLRPTKFDLKETGKLGEMARVIVLLSHVIEDEDGELFIDIAKARDGSIGWFKVKGNWESNRIL